MSDIYDGDIDPSSPQGADDTGQSSDPQDGATSVDDQSSAPASVPSFRLRQETERRQAVERAYEQAAQTIQALNARIASMQGQPQGQPQTQPGTDPNVRIREQFARVFPELAALAERAKDIEGLLQQAPSMSAQTEHYWTQVGSDFLRSLDGQITSVYGDKISPAARGFFQTAFINWVESDAQVQRRYLQRDPNLVTDFWTTMRSHVLDPVRRSAAVTLEQRGKQMARLPQSGPTTPPPTRGPAKPKTEDELHDAAFAALFAQGD